MSSIFRLQLYRTHLVRLIILGALGCSLVGTLDTISASENSRSAVVEENLATHTSKRELKESKAKDSSTNEATISDQAAEPGEVTIDNPINPDDYIVPRLEVSSTERKKICKKFEGALIAYYDTVYQVENCIRRPLVASKTIYNFQKRGRKIIEVDSRVIKALTEGEPYDVASTRANARKCNDLEGRYITFSNVDVYFVQECRKRLFPDWTTYIAHREQRNRQQRGARNGEILALSWIEFAKLRLGESFNSVMDDYLEDVDQVDGIEVLPLSEACDGISGKLVSYLSKLYRIEDCQKREITAPDLYLRDKKFQKIDIKRAFSKSVDIDTRW